jgi:hypothetical protein
MVPVSRWPAPALEKVETFVNFCVPIPLVDLDWFGILVLYNVYNIIINHMLVVTDFIYIFTIKLLDKFMNNNEASLQTK